MAPLELGEKRFDGVPKCSKFFPCDVALAVRFVLETAGLVVGVVVQHCAPPVGARVGVGVGGFDRFVDGPTVVLIGHGPPPFEVAP